MPVDSYSIRDYWKSIILYGLNNATYKITLGKTLPELAKRGTSNIGWNVLSVDLHRNWSQ